MQAELNAPQVAPEKLESELEGVDVKRWYDGRRKLISLYNAEGLRVPLDHVGRDRSVFLCLSGPSLAKTDLSLLQKRGIVTMGLNNSPAAFAAQGLKMPNLWVCVDSASHFIEQIWKDPAVMKFAPLGHVGAKIKTRSRDGALIDSSFKVEDCPNCLYFNRNSRFDPAKYLTETDFSWGNSGGVKDPLGISGSRSVMLVAVKLLWYLGFKKVYLLGADFGMSNCAAQNYAFPQARTPASVSSNNATYAALNSRFRSLRPCFDRAGFQVLNCTPQSGLQAFPSSEYEKAVRDASKEVTEKEINTLGHYDQKKK